MWVEAKGGDKGQDGLLNPQVPVLTGAESGWSQEPGAFSVCGGGPAT